MIPGMLSVLHPLGMYLLDNTRTYSIKRFHEMGSRSSMSLSSSVEYLFQSAFLKFKRLLNGDGCGTTTRFTVTKIERCCVWGMGSIIDFSHI